MIAVKDNYNFQTNTNSYDFSTLYPGNNQYTKTIPKQAPFLKLIQTPTEKTINFSKNIWIENIDQRESNENFINTYLNKQNPNYKGVYEKLNDSIYIENLCNIQENNNIYEIKNINNNEKYKIYQEMKAKIINIFEKEPSINFPDKLPGNNILKNHYPDQRINEAASKIQNKWRKYKKTKKIDIDPLIKMYGMKTLNISDSFDEEKPIKPPKYYSFKKPINEIKKPIILKKSEPIILKDKYSVINLFVKSNINKIPIFTSLKELSPKIKPKVEKIIKQETKLKKNENTSQIEEDYSQDFEEISISVKSKKSNKKNNNQSDISEILESIKSVNSKTGSIKEEIDINSNHTSSISEENNHKSKSIEEIIDFEFEDNSQKKSIIKSPNLDNSYKGQTKKTVNFSKEKLKSPPNQSPIKNITSPIKNIKKTTIINEDNNQSILPGDRFISLQPELLNLNKEIKSIYQDLSKIKPLSNVNYTPLKSNSDLLYSKFQIEFDRLLNLKNANEILKNFEKKTEIIESKYQIAEDLKLKPGKKLMFEKIIDIEKNIDIIIDAFINQNNKNNDDKFKKEIFNLKETQNKIFEKLESDSQLFQSLVNKIDNITINNIITYEKNGQLVNIEKENNLKQINVNNINNSIEKNDEKIENKFINNEKHEKTQKIESEASIEEDLNEYVPDFESLSHVSESIAHKSPKIEKEIISAGMRSSSMLSSDKEINENEDLGISWNSIPIIKPTVINSQEIEAQKTIDWIFDKIINEEIKQNNLFPIRNQKEIDNLLLGFEKKKSDLPVLGKKAVNNLDIFNIKPAINRQELESELQESPTKSSSKGKLNLEQFEEKSPTKMQKKQKKNSKDDLLHTSLEISIRNEGFISESEKIIRSLESKLKRRNNDKKIRESVQLIHEDLFSKINIFNETDSNQREKVILDAFNEQFKQKIISEINSLKKKESYFSDYNDKIEEYIVKNYKKICEQTKKTFIKQIQNQLKELEYQDVDKEDFDKLVLFCEKTQYPLEEEENVEILEYQILEEIDEWKKEMVNNVMIECIDDVINELNRIEIKKK